MIEIRAASKHTDWKKLYSEEEAEEGVSAVTFTDGTDEQGGEIISCTVELFSFVRLDELAYDTAEFTLQTKVIKRETGEDGNVTFTEVDREDDIRKLKESGYKCVRIYFKSEHHISDWEGYVGSAFYVKEVVKLSDREYRVSCVSELGTVANGAHRGGLYMQDSGGNSGSSSGGALIKEILPDAEVADTAPEVDGWLPYDTNRNNLKRILQALLLRSTYDEKTGAPKFEWYSNSTKGINRLKTFTGWNIEEPTTTKLVTGKVFELGTANCASSVYSGSLSSDNYETIVFSRPVLPSSVNNSSATNATINNTANVNWCEAKANTSGANVSINGNYYDTGTRLVTAETPENETTTGEVEEVELEENGLLRHAQAAAEYVSFYSEVANSSVATLDCIYEGEKPGDCVTLAMSERGTIDKITVSLTSIARASMSVIDGFIPFSGEYDNMAIVTTNNSNYQISNANQNRVRVLAYHGGGGGSGGRYVSTNNTSAMPFSGAYDRKGGTNSAGGDAGGYTEYLYTLNSATANLNITLGNGGNGGDRGGNSQNGAETVVEVFNNDWLQVTEANVNNSAAQTTLFSNGVSYYMSFPGLGATYGGSCGESSLLAGSGGGASCNGGAGFGNTPGGTGGRTSSGTHSQNFSGGGGGGGFANGGDSNNVGISYGAGGYNAGNGGSGGGGGGAGGFRYVSVTSTARRNVPGGAGGLGGNGIGGGGNGGNGGNGSSSGTNVWCFNSPNGGRGGVASSSNTGSSVSNYAAYGGGGGAGGYGGWGFSSQLRAQGGGGGGGAGGGGGGGGYGCTNKNTQIEANVSKDGQGGGGGHGAAVLYW